MYFSETTEEHTSMISIYPQQNNNQILIPIATFITGFVVGALIIKNYTDTLQNEIITKNKIIDEMTKNANNNKI